MRRLYLKVEYSVENNEEVKSLGAEFDWSVRKWYYGGDDNDYEKFAKWFIKPRRYMDVDRNDKDIVKELGAKWDPEVIKWYYESEERDDRFDKWSLKDRLNITEGYLSIIELYESGKNSVNSSLRFDIPVNGNNCFLIYNGENNFKDSLMFSFNGYLVSFFVFFDKVREIYTFNSYIENAEVFSNIREIFRINGRVEVRKFFEHIFQNIKEYIREYEHKDRMQNHSRNNPQYSAYFHHLKRRKMSDQQYEKIISYAGYDIARLLKDNNLNAWFTNDISKKKDLKAEINDRIGSIKNILDTF
ncbi:DUF5710 domain-containing protein [Fusobacterium sp. PH5-44]|uniref:DUF5710 domain-containing protein n=1 Tax=unclassified Fusobacterium TaxID=2648384 RepID=UPI003D1D74E6